MEVIAILIPIAIIIVIIGVALFFWAVNSGQYDDLDSPAHRILFDDEILSEKEKIQPSTKTSIRHD